MKNPALRAIEDAYTMGLNPDLDYLSQLQPLAPSGELANKLTSNQVLFKLCMIVDSQHKEIEQLKEDRVAIAKKMVELSAQTPHPQPPASTPVIDPSAPLG